MSAPLPDTSHASGYSRISDEMSDADRAAKGFLATQTSLEESHQKSIAPCSRFARHSRTPETNTKAAVVQNRDASDSLSMGSKSSSKPLSSVPSAALAYHIPTNCAVSRGGESRLTALRLTGLMHSS